MTNRNCDATPDSQPQYNITIDDFINYFTLLFFNLLTHSSHSAHLMHEDEVFPSPILACALPPPGLSNSFEIYAMYSSQ